MPRAGFPAEILAHAGLHEFAPQVWFVVEREGAVYRGAQASGRLCQRRSRWRCLVRASSRWRRPRCRRGRRCGGPPAPFRSAGCRADSGHTVRSVTASGTYRAGFDTVREFLAVTDVHTHAVFVVFGDVLQALFEFRVAIASTIICILRFRSSGSVAISRSMPFCSTRRLMCPTSGTLGNTGKRQTRCKASLLSALPSKLREL